MCLLIALSGFSPLYDDCRVIGDNPKGIDLVVEAQRFREGSILFSLSW